MKLNKRKYAQKINRSQAAKKYLKEYCNSSTIHGVRYFTEEKRHWSERLWWVIAFGLSVWMCGTSIHNIWTKWHNSPVSLIFTGRENSISTIPFPTVTICSETKTSKLKFDVMAALQSFANLSDINATRLDALTHICPMLPDILLTVYPRIDCANFTDDSIYNIIQDMAPNITETMLAFQWKDLVEFMRSEFVVPILTDSGVCFTFNALNSFEIYTEVMAPGMMTVNENSNISQWSLEDGYKSEINENENEYPLRMVESGRGAALQFGLIILERDFEYFCRGFDQGFKIALTMPGDALKMSQNTLRVPVLEDTLIMIKPRVTHTSEGLWNYAPNQRQCFFSTERQLRFFKLYTQNNCEAECLANFTKTECGCVKFSMPRDKNTRICGAGRVRCYRAAEKTLMTNNAARLFRKTCNCLPGCTSIEYNANIDRVRFDWDAVKRANKVRMGIGGPQLTRLAIFFQDQQVETVQRTEVYTWTDFMAVCGGLIGLFLGVSALSVIEFLYYLTLRLYWKFRQWKFMNVVTPFGRATIDNTTTDKSDISSAARY